MQKLQLQKLNRTSKIRLIIVMAVIVFADLSPLGGNIILYSQLIRCGGMPYVPVSTFAGQVPYYDRSNYIVVLDGYHKYYCTPVEAQSDGLSASNDVYSFPDLPKSEFQNLIKKSRSYH